MNGWTCEFTTFTGKENLLISLGWLGMLLWIMPCLLLSLSELLSQDLLEE